MSALRRTVSAVVRFVANRLGDVLDAASWAWPSFDGSNADRFLTFKFISMYAYARRIQEGSK